MDQSRAIKTKHLSIMFTDMKGFTVKTSTQSREQLHQLLELQDTLIRPAIAHYDGTIVKTIGDAFLVTFESPTDAVLCGMKIQENILNHNARAGTDSQMDVRIAINSGEVNIRDNDIFGEPVNITSRIESIAEPNEVYFTEAVYLAMNKNEIPTAEVGHRKLKGIPEEVKVYKVLGEQTNLIRARLKRQEQATENAHLEKDVVHEGRGAAAPIPNEATVSHRSSSSESVPTAGSVTPSFLKRHKKKISIGLAILLLLGILSENGRLKKQLVQNGVEVMSERQIRAKMEIIRDDFASALRAQDTQAVTTTFEEIRLIAQTQALPADVHKGLREFAQRQLEQNQQLTSDQKKILKEIISATERN